MSFKGKSCYFCGAPSVSKEHAPVKQMFKGFDCDRITVPSCEKHNNAKGGNDQAIISAMLIPIDNHPSHCSLGEDVLKAIKIARRSFEYAKRMAFSSPLIKDLPQHVKLSDVSFLKSSAGMADWVRMLSAALIWDALQRTDGSINWEQVGVYSPDWMNSVEPLSFDMAQAVAELRKHRDNREHFNAYPWEEGWSSKPKPYPPTLYRFSVAFIESDLLFWHKFYDSYSWYVSIDNVSRSIANGIRKKLPASDREA